MRSPATNHLGKTELLTPRNYRRRLYPRCATILRQLAEPRARLLWMHREGIYRLNGLAGREYKIIARTLRKLLRLGCVREIRQGDPTLRITATGRELLQKHDRTAAIARRRRCTEHPAAGGEA